MTNSVRPPNGRNQLTPVPDLIDDRDLRQKLHRGELFAHDHTSRDMRPATILHALMEQAPGDPLQESVEDTEGLQAAIGYAARCCTAEDTYVLNAICSEQVTFDVLGGRLGVSRTHAWRLYQRALARLRTLLLNQPEVRERLNMEPSWQAAAMDALIGIASFEEDWDADNPPYLLADAADDIAECVSHAVGYLENGKELHAVSHMEAAAMSAVAYLRYVGKWSLIKHHALLCSKQHDYGHDNILRFGMFGVVVRMSDKAARLTNLSAGSAAPRNESVLDTFFDVIGYAVVARMLKNETFELQLANEVGSTEKTEENS